VYSQKVASVAALRALGFFLFFLLSLPSEFLLPGDGHLPGSIIFNCLDLAHKAQAFISLVVVLNAPKFWVIIMGLLSGELVMAEYLICCHH